MTVIAGSVRPIARATKPIVVALLLDRAARARLSDAVRSTAQIAFCDRIGDVTDHIARCQTSLVILESRDQAGLPTAPLITRIRRGFPSVAVLAYAVPGRTPSGEIVLAARAGAHELIMAGFDDIGIAFRIALESAVRRCGASRISAGLAEDIPADIESFFGYCLERAAHDPSVADAARYLGVHRKTLVHRLGKAAFPPPSQVIGWCRVLLAGHLLEDPHRSVEQVALALDFPSASALRGMLRRYANLRPQEVRAGGGLTCLLPRFKQSLKAKRTQAELVR